MSQTLLWDSDIEIAVTTANRPSSKPAPRWWVPVLLALPSLIPLVSSFWMARSQGLVATGFVQFDQPYYLASGRAFFDEGFHLTYGNPYANYGTPRIYFQPHLFLLGCLQQLRLDPGLTWNIFALVGVLFAAFVAVRFYTEVVGWRSTSEKLGLVCFFWGGGILTLSGFVYACLVGKLNILTILHFDPSAGWWMLNFGRNLVYGPTEAIYHALFLLSMLFLLRKRYTTAIAFAVLISLCHPWTGIESSIIVAAYLTVERLFGNTAVRIGHIAAAAALVVLHVGYYLVFLNKFADHRVLQGRWQTQGVSWLYPAYAFVPALIIVAGFAIARLTRWPGFLKLVSDPANRLFLLWFLIVFGISQHFRVVKPLEPIHFAHGYDWTALFFLGAPVLISLLDRLLCVRAPWQKLLAVCAFLTFFLFDNLFWFAAFAKPYTSQAIIITKEQKEVLNWLGNNASPPDLVVTADAQVSYLVKTYSRVRSWAGYGADTPHWEQRVIDSQRAFGEGLVLPEWSKMNVLYIKRTAEDASWQAPSACTARFHDARYEIWECPPLPTSADASQLPPPLSGLNHR